MLVWLICVILLVAVGVSEQRRAAFSPRHQELMQSGGPGCSVRFCQGRECRPYTISTPSDLELRVPGRNVSHAHLVFSANHSVRFGRGTLPRQLGGDDLVRLLVSVRHAPRRRLPSGFFVNLPGLRSLQLYHDAPDSDHFSLRLSADTFQGLTELVELELAQLGIEDLPRGVFASLPSICRLDLSQNRLTVVRSDVFQPPSVSVSAANQYHHNCCSNLTILSLSRNRFVDIADIHVGRLTSLKSLDVSENVIANLSRNGFLGPSNSTPSGAFAQIRQLNLALNVIDQVIMRSFLIFVV